MIPQSFIQELLARVDIVDVIERYLPLKKSGANYFACCPFHGEKSPSFSVSPSKQFYHCFGCGAHGSAIGFLMEYSGLGFVDAVKDLAGQLGMQLPQDERSARSSPDTSSALHDALLKAAEYYRQQLKASPAAVAYLKNRGLSGEIAARFGLGFAPDRWQGLEEVFPAYDSPILSEAGLVIDHEQGRRYDRFRGRIMFPIHDRRGRVIAFGGRILDAGEPKYLNSPETPLFDKGRELYGLHLAYKAIRDEGFVLVVEGYMDVVALAQFGLANAVATLGTATTAQHVHALLRQTARVVFCFDGDAAGRRAAWRALENALGSLRDDATLAFLFLPAEHDPDSFVRSEGVEALRAAATAAMPLTTFLVEELSSRQDMESAEGRAAFVHQAAPLLAQVPARLLQLQMAKAVAAASRFTQDEVEHAVALATSTAPVPPAAAGAGSSGREHRAAPSGPRTTRVARRSRRRPPSTASTLLRLLLQFPALATRLPIELAPTDSAEGLALVALIDYFSLGETLQGDGFGSLIEHFRDSPHARTLGQAAAELVDTEFDESIIDTLFEDSLRKLHADRLNDEINQLLQRDREQALDSTARQHLASLLKQRSELAGIAKPQNL